MNLLPTDAELVELLSPLQVDDEAKLMQTYHDLVRDKRTGDGVACSQWFEDCCHCHKVPGNLHDDIPPHTVENHLGKPWCVAHQSQDCSEPHPFVTLEQFVERERRRRSIVIATH